MCCRVAGGFGAQKLFVDKIAGALNIYLSKPFLRIVSSTNKLIEVSFPTNLQKRAAHKLRGDSVQNIIRGKIYGSTISILQHIPAKKKRTGHMWWRHRKCGTNGVAVI